MRAPMLWKDTSMQAVLRQVAKAMVVVLGLAPVTGRAATVTLDLTSLGTVSLAAGQSKTVTLGASTSTVDGVTTTTSGLTVTLMGMTAAGGISTRTSHGVRTINSFDTSGGGQDIYNASLNFSSSGAGVQNSREGLLGLFFRDATSLDATGGNADFIEVMLSQAATLNNATFTELSYSSNNRTSLSSMLWAYDSNNSGSINSGDVISQAMRLNTVSAGTFNNTASDAFLIGASGSNSSFLLKSLTLSYTPVITYTNVGAVPLPAGGLLMLGALGGLGLIRRRRRG